MLQGQNPVGDPFGAHLGDNPHDSMDSRGVLGSVPVSRLIGRPAAILAPSNRARFFVR